MKIVEPYAKIADIKLIPFSVEDGINMLKRIEHYGRVSHRSEEAQDANHQETYGRFIRSVVLGHGDLSIIEHESVTVEMVVDRGITHEIVRHRIGSYTQESTRFVNYDKPEHEPTFIKPLGMTDSQTRHWTHAIGDASEYYKYMLQAGAAPQIARSVLPNALASKIIVTYNLRSWRHFFIMRTSREAHPQMKQVTIPLLKEFQEKIPILFEDIVPEMKQSEAMRLLR